MKKNSGGAEIEISAPSTITNQPVELESTVNDSTVDVSGQRVLHPGVDEFIDLVTELKAEGFNMVVDLTAVDYSLFQAEKIYLKMLNLSGLKSSYQ